MYISGSKNLLWFEKHTYLVRKRTYLAGKIDLSGSKIYKSGSKNSPFWFGIKDLPGWKIDLPG